MDKFCEKYNFPKVTQEEVDNWNNHITIKYTEFVIIIKKLFTKKTQGPDSFTGKFYHAQSKK